MEAFKRTTALLNWNPEFYTAWNYRRDILLKGIFPDSTPESINDYLNVELDTTMQQLKSHPKVYWIWNHRRWCLENVSDGPGSEGVPLHGWKKANWDRELYVVENMLERDARNFLAWDYRRYVLASHPNPRSTQDELVYTKKKIENNFSNFSAWHQRSKVYMSNADTRELLQQAKESEFMLVRSALWTDPGDQSAWIYHRWLLGETPPIILLEREIGVVEEILAEEPESKWCLESLVHYKTQLARHPEYRGQTVVLDDDRREALMTLEKLDPLRRNRYQEMGAALQESRELS